MLSEKKKWIKRHKSDRRGYFSTYKILSFIKIDKRIWQKPRNQTVPQSGSFLSLDVEELTLLIILIFTFLLDLGRKESHDL